MAEKMTPPPATDTSTLPVPDPRHERIARDGFWRKFRRVIGRIPFSEDLAAAYYCALDAQTPLRVRGVIWAALAYFVVPMDLIPDFVAGFGFTDDATVLATAIGIVAAHIKPPHRTRARAALELPPSDDKA
jgi:uncharacterized membrane protein YkvA (DUF1232 family)